MEMNFQRGLHRHLKGFIKSQVWGHAPVVLAVRRLRQEDREIKSSPDNIAKSNLKGGGISPGFQGCRVFCKSVPLWTFSSCHPPEACDQFIPIGQSLSTALVASEYGEAVTLCLRAC